MFSETAGKSPPGPVRYCATVKPAMVRVCLVKSAAPFFQCANALIFTVIVLKPLYRAAGIDCGADCSLTVRPMKHSYFIIHGNNLKVSVLRIYSVYVQHTGRHQTTVNVYKYQRTSQTLFFAPLCYPNIRTCVNVY